MVQMNQFAGQKLRHRCREQTYGHQGGKVVGGGGGVINWEIGIDMYTLICIKCISNKNLLYKKINKIKFKNSKKKGSLTLQSAWQCALPFYHFAKSSQPPHRKASFSPLNR